MNREKYAILTACFFETSISKNCVMNRLDVSNEMLSKIECVHKSAARYEHRSANDYTTKQGKNQLQCFLNFCHFGESLYIESKSCLMIEINGEACGRIVISANDCRAI